MNPKLINFLKNLRVNRKTKFNITSVYENSFKVVGSSEELKKIFYIWGFDVCDFIRLKQVGETSLVYDAMGIIDKKWSRIWR